LGKAKSGIVNNIPKVDFRELYIEFDIPVVPLDCGKMCAPHNPGGKPICCDICHAVPSAYHQEWDYLRPNTDLWHVWRGDECHENPEDPNELDADTPDTMLLLACLGPMQCQRDYRSLSCRQFPFFPYITSDYGFFGLAYNWEFEEQCWVISNLGEVTEEYRQNFVQVYDNLFSQWPQELDHYANRSEQMRDHYINQKCSISLLHRDGGFFLIRPLNERIRRVEPTRLPKFGPYLKIE
jgi:hypothetical protein